MFPNMQSFLEESSSAAPGGAARPNPANRSRLFSNFVRATFIFGAHVATIILFLILFFAVHAGFFGSLILATAFILPAGYFIDERGLFYKFILGQFAIGFAIGCLLYIIGAF